MFQLFIYLSITSCHSDNFIQFTLLCCKIICLCLILEPWELSFYWCVLVWFLVNMTMEKRVGVAVAVEMVLDLDQDLVKVQVQLKEQLKLLQLLHQQPQHQLQQQQPQQHRQPQLCSQCHVVLQLSLVRSSWSSSSSSSLRESSVDQQLLQQLLIHSSQQVRLKSCHF